MADDLKLGYSGGSEDHRREGRDMLGKHVVELTLKDHRYEWLIDKY